jgi:formylmethanofuran dehydrogenase subunit E-like metal-binding protein
MKRIAIFAALALITTLASVAFASDTMTPFIKQAMEELKAKNGDPHLCVLTDAPYVSLNGESCSEVVDELQNVTGCSVGRKNLLFFQRPVNHPLLVALHRQDKGETVVIRHDGASAQTIRFNMKGDTAAEPATFGEIQKKLKGDAFTVVTLLTAHAKGAPYDFLKCCEHHNHYCPGVTSGYFIAHFILEKCPKAAGEQYFWFACPPWCKDDAISTMHLSNYL